MTALKRSDFNALPFVFAVMFVPGHLFGWLIEWVWLAVQLSLAMFYFSFLGQRFEKTSGVTPKYWIVFFLLFLILASCGALYSATFLGAYVSIFDIPDILRFLIYLPLALFIGAILKENDIAGVSKVLKLVIIFNLLCAFALILKLPVLANLIMAVYGEAKVQLDYGHIRIGIPFTNPNFAALVFVLTFSFFVFFERSVKFGLLSIVCIFLTGSRSGWIAALPLIVLSYMVIFNNMMSLKKLKRSIIFFALHLLPLYYMETIIESFESLPRLLELVNALNNGGFSGVETASIRFEVVDSAFKFIKRSPLIGWGPGRSYGLDVIDSQLISWIVLMGVPGALLICGFFSALFINIGINSRDWLHRLAALTTCMSFFLLLGTGDFMKNYRLFFIVVLFTHVMGLIVVKKNKENRL